MNRLHALLLAALLVFHIPCDAGEVRTWQEGEITWVAKDTTGLPGWKFEQFASVEDINAVKIAQTTGWIHKVIWAWENEALGEIRMRTFAPDWGITEAESNGSGAIFLLHSSAAT